VCNKTPEKAQAAANAAHLAAENIYSDYKQLLSRNDIDAVDLLVPISENYEVARDVIQAEKI
jgi:predicted dehydrogenase